MYFTEFNPSYPMTPGEQNQVVTPILQISNNLTSDEVRLGPVAASGRFINTTIAIFTITADLDEELL